MQNRCTQIIPLVFMLLIFAPSPAMSQSEIPLLKQWQHLNYSFEDCRHHSPTLPRVAYNRVPTAFTTIQNSQTKKRVFLQFLLPLLAQENERINQQRAHLLNLSSRMDAGNALTESEHRWLNAQCAEYKLKECDRDELLKRIDTIPVSLALAQAAIESGWGSSRFAQEGNALFGQWVNQASIGMTPSKRSTGKSHGVGQFNTPQASIRSYFLNLNTHHAYQTLRELRHQHRLAHHESTGLELAAELKQYSELKERYVSIVQSIIKNNHLEACNGIQLSKNTSQKIILSLS